MTIDEAIKELEALLINRKTDLLRDTLKAIPLGIEALKRLNDWRAGKILNPDFMLPGETEEVK